MAAKTEAPSTAPEGDPLAESLARIMGANPMSKTTGTASPIAYDPEQSFRQPQADVINISGDPGTGATTSESWSHDIALENLRREQLQFEYEQQQAAIANELRAQESLRAETQLGLTKAEAARAVGLYPTQKATAEQALASARQDMALKAAQEERLQGEAWVKYGGMTLPQYQASIADLRDQMRYQGGAPITSKSVDAYLAQRGQPTTQYYTPTGQYVPGGYQASATYQQPAGYGNPSQSQYAAALSREKAARR